MATDGMVTTVTFSCMTGYTLIGDGSLTCDQNGNWENLLPTCGKYNYFMTIHRNVWIYHYVFRYVFQTETTCVTFCIL